MPVAAASSASAPAAAASSSSAAAALVFLPLTPAWLVAMAHRVLVRVVVQAVAGVALALLRTGRVRSSVVVVVVIVIPIVVLATLELADAEERVHDQHQIEPLDHAADALMPHGFFSCQSKQKQRSKLKINDGDGALQPGPPSPDPLQISDI